MIRRQTAPSRALQHAASLFLLLLLLSSLSSSYAKGLGRRRRQMPSLWLYKKGGESNHTSASPPPSLPQEDATPLPPPPPPPVHVAPQPPVTTRPKHQNFFNSPTKDKMRMVREAVFPIYGREVKKFFSMGMIKFLIVFVLTITRDVKDTLIVTSCGAESIAFLKVYGVLPAAAAFTVIYSKMSNVLSKDALYYALVTPFFIFYLLFDLVIYPRREMLHPVAAATPVEGLGYLVGLYQNWTFALYYIVSEIYSSVSIGLLFWQFANDVITVDEAKRFYPLFGQLSSIAPIIAGQCVARVAERADFGSSLRILTILTTLCGAGIMVLYKYCSINIKKDAEAGLLDQTLVTNLQQRKSRPQLSMRESGKFLMGSRYLQYMAVLVLGFGLAINFTDIVWKSMVKDYFPDKMHYQRFMGYYSSTVGATTFVVIFFGSNIVKHLGWRIGALATPVMMAFLAVPFFGAIFLKGVGTSNAENKKMAFIAVAFGALMSVLSKATKYALFDPTTQMAYIPLDEESKSKGKAAIDVLGSRLGKSVGALLLQACVVAFGSAIRASYVVGGMFYAVIFSWIFSANNLSVMFNELTDRRAASASAAGTHHKLAASSSSSTMPPPHTPRSSSEEGGDREVPAEVPPPSAAPEAFLIGGLNPHIAPPMFEDAEEGVGGGVGSEEGGGEGGEGGGGGEEQWAESVEYVSDTAAGEGEGGGEAVEAPGVVAEEDAFIAPPEGGPEEGGGGEGEGAGEGYDGGSSPPPPPPASG